MKVKKKVGNISRITNKICLFFEKDIRTIILLTLLVCLIDGIYFFIGYMVNSDEFSSISVSAYLAGMDWSLQVASSEAWHGYGATILLSPLFYFFKNGFIMYKLFQFECLAFRIGMTIMTYYIAKRNFEINGIEAFLIALACNFGNLSPDDGAAISVMSEVPIAFLIVLIMALTLKVMKSEKKRRIFYSVLIAFILIYSLTIHSRGMIVIGTYIITLIIYMIIYKDSVVQVIPFILGLIGSYALYKYVNTSIIQMVYTYHGDVANLNNNASNMLNNGLGHIVKSFYDWDMLKNSIKIFISLMGSFTLFSFGLIWVIVIANVQYIVKSIKEKRKTSLFFLSCYGLISFFAMNLFYAIKCQGDVAKGDLKGFTYIRYGLPFVWIIVLTGFVILLKKKCECKYTLIISSVANLICTLIFMGKTVPWLRDEGYGLTKSIFNRYFWYGGKSYNSVFGLYIVLMGVCLFIFFVCNFSKKYMYFITIYILISLIFFYEAFDTYLRRDKHYAELANASIAYVENVGSVGPEYKIYYKYMNEKKYIHMLRMGLPDEEIYYVTNMQEIDFDNSLLLVDSNICFEESGADYVFILDNNECLLTSNESIIENLIKLKYKDYLQGLDYNIYWKADYGSDFIVDSMPDNYVYIVNKNRISEVEVAGYNCILEDESVYVLIHGNEIKAAVEENGLFVCPISIVLEAETIYNDVDYSGVYNYMYYASNNHDLYEKYGTDTERLLEYFVTVGILNGEQGNAQFNLLRYKERYEELQEMFGDDYESYYLHYIYYGISEGRVGN